MKLTTIITAAALGLALTAGAVQTTDAHDGPRLILKGDDTAIVLRDGRILQTEYIGYHALHRNDPGYVIWDDGSPGLVSHDGCRAQNPNGDVFALRDC